MEVKYSFREIENTIYKKWLECKSFEPVEKGETFVISIPPPNITGRLHMGHALNSTVQDFLIRYHRKKGFRVLWIPGTDHAGIATQTVVKKQLDEQKIDYRGLGREKFIKKIWEWKKKYGDLILTQLKALGVSCDWNRTRFTMDEGLNCAVNLAFKKLYDDGLIYKGKRIVNWCPIDKTALSDDEVETEEGGEPGFLWHISYSIINSNQKTGDSLVVATTRPETLFGDTAIAVHPEDERYSHLKGQYAMVPECGRKIPIIFDTYVDKEFGSGCVKITPAHDPNDYEVSKRHNLPVINIMNEDASMNREVPTEYQELSRESCRKVLLKNLKNSGKLVKEEPRMIPIGRSYRSRAIIEYRLSEQWFVKMKPLRDKVMTKHNELTILPQRWDKVYRYWMDNIRDWCISRQIWWGHQIPAWIHKDTKEVLVNEVEPEVVKNAPDEWQRDPDVLDTWFSSALWPMSVLGWPKKTDDFKAYFPNTVLSTAKDILFFWVARMNIMSCYFEGVMPYRFVYIHPTITDERGEAMSKSKGNGIDPLHIINGASVDDLKTPILEVRPTKMQEMLANIDKKYRNGFEGVGADVLRFTLIYLSSSGQELKLNFDNFLEIGRRFVNKLWNASRFILMAAQKCDKEISVSFDPKNVEELWIGARISQAEKKIEKLTNEYQFNSIGLEYYNLVWSDFCDWYIEICKSRLNSDNSLVKKQTVVNALYFYHRILHLMNPLVPFVTEHIYGLLKTVNLEKKLGLNIQDDMLISALFPQELLKSDNKQLDIFSLLKDIISQIRSFKSSNGLKVKEAFPLLIKIRDLQIEKNMKFYFSIIKDLAFVSSIHVFADDKNSKLNFTTKDYAHKVVSDSFTLYFKVELKTINTNQNRQIKSLEKDIEFCEKKLSNPEFLSKGKPEIVEKEKEKLRMSKKKLQQLK